MNKSTKIRILYTLVACIMLVVMLLFLSGCDGKTIPSNSERALAEEVTYTQVMATGTIFYTFQDPRTGVWYYCGYDGGITPRYNKDGSLYWTEIVQ